ncbi:FecCD family ABC transporter permease [Brockia lithotrophica]|nr:iron ABC transporter permease [Brockia lithotrophica]
MSAYRVSPERQGGGAGGRWGYAVLLASPLFVFFLSLFVGRYPVSWDNALWLLTAGFVGSPPAPAEQPLLEAVLFTQRLPRGLLALFLGAGMGIAGASFQAIFRNPLVSPDILGATPAAAFGVATGILFWGFSLPSYALGFLTGLVSQVLVLGMSRVRVGDPRLVLLLSGIVTGAFFSALVSFVKYVADPQDKLPAITYWLMGSLAHASPFSLRAAGVSLFLGGGILLALAYRLNVLSLSDEEALSLGVHPQRLRAVVVAAVALLVTTEVAAAGVIGWVGLLVPHLARMLVGPEHRRLLPAAASVGASFLLVVDVLARTLTAAEIPLGILTALVGAPGFYVLLRRTGGRWG